MRRVWPLGAAVALYLLVWFLQPGGFSMSDDELHQLLNEGKTAEALAWAKEVEGTTKLRTIHELDNLQSLAIIKRLYELGAIKVTAIDIESLPEVGETTNMLIVELPDDPKLRRGLFAFESQHASRLGFNRTRDQGQRYLMFWWT